MLTFLRKIRRSLIESSSTRKSVSSGAERYLLYAIGEIALVVIGILIALQINNWNEFRKERATETKVLKEVAENLEANIQRLESMIDRCRIDNESADRIISVIHNKLPYNDSLNPMFYYALNPVDEGSFLSYVGYESLKNVGFEIIQDNQLKKEVINLFEGIYRELRSKYDRIGQFTSAAVSKFRQENFLFRPDTVRNQMGLEPLDFDNLIEDNRFESHLVETKGVRGWVSLTLDQSLAETLKVLQLIRDELQEADQFQ